MMGRANADAGPASRCSRCSRTSTPQLYLDIDRVKAQMLGINVADVFAALQTYLGSAYVNDFNLLGPHLPRDGAGRLQLPPDAQGRAQDPRAQLATAIRCRSDRSRP